MSSSNTDVEKFIIDGADFPIVDPVARTAEGTNFNNTGTTLSSTNTESAIKEVNNSLTQLDTTVTTNLLPSDTGNCVNPATNLTFGQINVAVRVGRFVTVTCNFVTSSQTNTGVKLFDLPYKSRINCNIECVNDSNKTAYIIGTSDYNSKEVKPLYYNLPAGTYRFSFSYIKSHPNDD